MFTSRSRWNIGTCFGERPGHIAITWLRLHHLIVIWKKREETKTSFFREEAAALSSTATWAESALLCVVQSCTGLISEWCCVWITNVNNLTDWWNQQSYSSHVWKSSVCVRETSQKHYHNLVSRLMLLSNLPFRMTLKSRLFLRLEETAMPSTSPKTKALLNFNMSTYLFVT